MQQEAEGSFFVGANNNKIPTRETAYIDFCLDITNEFLLSNTSLDANNIPPVDGIHIIGVEPIIDTRTTEYVHHFVATTGGIGVGGTSASCGGDDGAGGYLISGNVIYGWAPGSLPFNPPNYLGFKLDGTFFGDESTNVISSINVQTHYNNPENTDGLVDSSGIQVYWTTKKRQYDIGAIQLGDPLIRLGGTKIIGDDNNDQDDATTTGTSIIVKHTFSCPVSCMSLALGGLAQPITVFGASFHMHKSGTRAYTNVIRNGEVIHNLYVDFFDYDQNGVQPIQQTDTYELLPVDTFESSFYYDLPEWEKAQEFGLASEDEMAFATLYYYPRHTLSFGPFNFQPVCVYGIDGFSACNAIHTVEKEAKKIPIDGKGDIADAFLQCTFGQEPTTCVTSSGSASANSGDGHNDAPGHDDKDNEHVTGGDQDDGHSHGHSDEDGSLESSSENVDSEDASSSFSTTTWKRIVPKIFVVVSFNCCNFVH